ncbi:MAG: beta-hydroxyacyl-ACP dehydratase [Bacteroidales bacterium]|jgi:3-hydroxyacyl-[acyl-carrier-protein] dehydratase
MLKDLFCIESLDHVCENTLAATVTIDGNNPVFSGHFPGQPVLPGVCSLFLVRLCMERFLGKELHYQHIDFCKFPGMANPANPAKLFLKILWKEVNGTTQIKAEMKHGLLTVLKLQALLMEI